MFDPELSGSSDKFCLLLHFLSQSPTSLVAFFGRSEVVVVAIAAGEVEASTALLSWIIVPAFLEAVEVVFAASNLFGKRTDPLVARLEHACSFTVSASLELVRVPLTSTVTELLTSPCGS